MTANDASIKSENLKKNSGDLPKLLPSDRKKWARPSMRLLKAFAKRQLFGICERLDDTSTYIQKQILKTTLEIRRSALNQATPISEMDQDLLAMAIRWNAHHVEKAVRYAASPGTTRGSGPATFLRSMLDEWYRRNYPKRTFTLWAKENLADYAIWKATSVPHLEDARNG